MGLEALESEFFFAACQPGGEAFLKAEVARTHPRAKRAFSRPGVVTFKAGEPVGLDFEPGWVFAREYGAGLGRMTPAEIAAFAAQHDARIAVFPRDPSAVDASAVSQLRSELGRSASFASAEVVVDVIVGRDEPLLVGAHRVGGQHPRTAGGWIDVELPEEAPSRAYLKIEEAIRRSGAEPKAGETALEIGSAPGGACFALLRRGLRVHGVDPGEMAPIVLAFDRFTHHRVPAGALKRDSIPRPVHWFLLDVNLAAPVALTYAERAIGPHRKTLKGAFLTLKMNSLREADALPALVDRVRAFGFERVLATQLPSHRQEVAVIALRTATAT